MNEYGEVKNIKNGNLITGDVNNVGYYRVQLYSKNHNPPRQRFFRHRLVAEHFIENPNHLKEVNHKDLDKSNNHVSNLEWVDRDQNELHSRLNGTKPYKPFEVLYEDGTTELFHSKQRLAKKLNITKAAVAWWFKGASKGYRHYGIKEFHYI